jgi:hypothetical protein
MPHLEEIAFDAKPTNDLRPFTREEARRTLSEVRRRYGIDVTDPEAHQDVSMSSNAPTKAANRQPPTGNPQPTASKLLAIPVQRMRSKPYLDPQKLRHRNIPAPPSCLDIHIFHYLIQIAECAVALHCEVTAECESDARHHLKQIPNLLGWREISCAELSEIKDENARSKKTKRARFIGAVAAPF